MPTKIMINSETKYPKAVRAIYIAGKDDEAGRDVNVGNFESSRREWREKSNRTWDHEFRAMAMAGSKFFNTYLELHEASNEETKDGAIKHMAKNTIKAHKAALNVLKNQSKAFEYDPTQIHDNIVEYLEGLEEEYKKDDD
jgi:Family of unknown function (DUF6312)